MTETGKTATAFREVKKGVEVLASETLHLCKGRLLLRKAEEKSLVKDK